MNATKLDTSTFDTVIESADTPVLVDFWAPWCGPCQLLGPIIDEVAREQEGKAVITKVNIDESPELASRFGITSIPALVVFKNGTVVNQINGVHSKSVIEKALEAA